MKAILKKIELKTYETKDGKKFKKVEFICDVQINNKGEVKTVKGSSTEDYARKYLAYCGVKTKELIGKEVDVTLSKRNYVASDGDTRTITYIKFLNILDEDGNRIFMPKDNDELDF